MAVGFRYLEGSGVVQILARLVAEPAKREIGFSRV
jgi:hypothetical protein